jgi:hypothetical protein
MLKDERIQMKRGREQNMVALVVDANQVVGELLDSVGSHTGLGVLGVVGDEKSLLGLDNDDAFLALHSGVSVSKGE